MNVRRPRALLLLVFALTLYPAVAQTPAKAEKSPDVQNPAPAAVTVELRSDGRTYVSITNKMPPARFKSKIIVLLPGEYTAKGQRRGFKDEIVPFIVVPNMNPNTVTVICPPR